MIKMLRTFLGIKSPSKEFQKGLKTFDPFMFFFEIGGNDKNDF